MILQQNSTDVRVNYFYDEDNVIQPIDVLYERHNVNPNGLIQLKNIPSPLHTVFTIIRRNGTNVIQYNKVESVVNQYDFMVDYINGILTFHSSQVGKEIQISYTNSIGKLNISADIIFTNIDNQGNIVQTLGTMIDEGRSVLSDLSVLGGASKVITELQGYIESARELTGNIIQGSNINTELKKSTDTAKSTNTTLSSTITNANNKISDLNSWVESHGDIVNLDNRVGTAEDKLNTVSASLEHIAYDVCGHGALGDGVFDNTNIIQYALDNYSHILISRAGTYVTRTLEVKSNTKIELREGVVLKLKAGTKNYIITDKDKLGITENVTIFGGGKIDNCWNENNQKTGSYKTGLYPGHAVFFNHCKNIKLKNITITGAYKYSFLAVDIDGFVGENIYFEDTNSDGLHFQPPCKNVFINNVGGKTGDDTVAFTLGDYADYEVSNEGNFENVDIRNVYGNDSMCLFKATGSGLNSAYYFKNFNVENLYGTVTHGVVRVIDDTTALVNTLPINFKFKNISAKKSTTTFPDIELKCIGGDISFDNINTVSSSTITIQISQTIDMLTLKNVYGKLTTATFLQLEPNAVVKQLFFGNVNLTELQSTMIMNKGKIEKLFLNGFNVTGNNISSGTLLRNTVNSGFQMFLKASNFFIDKFNTLIRTNNGMKIKFTNGEIGSVSIRYLLDDLLTTSDTVFVTVNSCEGEFNPNKSSLTQGKFRINMDSGIYKTLKGQSNGAVNGDKIIQDYSSEAIGTFIYNGSRWLAENEFMGVNLILRGNGQGVVMQDSNGKTRKLGFNTDGSIKVEDIII